MRKTQQLKDFRNMSPEQLKERLMGLKETLFYCRRKTGAPVVLKDTKLIHNIRKEIARVKTVLGEKGVKV